MPQSIEAIRIARAIDEIADETVRIEGDVITTDGTHFEFWTDGKGGLWAYGIDKPSNREVRAPQEIEIGIYDFLVEWFPVLMAAGVLERVVTYDGILLMRF